MKTYRYGLKNNGITNWYSIERKMWLGWVEVYRFASYGTMLDAVTCLKDDGNFVFEIE